MKLEKMQWNWKGGIGGTFVQKTFSVLWNSQTTTTKKLNKLHSGDSGKKIRISMSSSST